MPLSTYFSLLHMGGGMRSQIEVMRSQITLYFVKKVAVSERIQIHSTEVLLGVKVVVIQWNPTPTTSSIKHTPWTLDTWVTTLPLLRKLWTLTTSIWCTSISSTHNYLQMFSLPSRSVGGGCVVNTLFETKPQLWTLSTTMRGEDSAECTHKHTHVHIKRNRIWFLKEPELEKIKANTWEWKKTTQTFHKHNKSLHQYLR